MFRSALALLAASSAVRPVDSQPQTLFKLSPYQSSYLSTPAACNVSSAFPTNETWGLSVVTPYSIEVLPVGETPVLLNIDSSDSSSNSNILIQNTGGFSEQRYLLGDCSSPVSLDSCNTLPTMISLNEDASLCVDISNSSSVSCTLFHSPLENHPGDASIRIYAKGFEPAIDSFPKDKTINLPPNSSFNFSYTTDTPSLAEFIAISNKDDLGTGGDMPFVFLSCYQNNQKAARKDLSPA